MSRGDLEIALPLGLVELALLHQHGVEIALQRGQRRAQVVRDVGDQLAPQAVGLLEISHARGHPLGHVAEGGAEPVDLVARVARRRGQQTGLDATVALEALHRGGEPPQPAREQAEHQQAGQRGEDDARTQPPGRELQHVAAADHGGDAVVALAAGDDVEIARQSPVAHHRRGGEDLLAVGLARVVAEHRQAVAVDEAADGCDVHVLAAHHARRRGPGQQVAGRVEQVHLDAGVHHHQRLEQRVHRGLRRLAVQAQVVVVDHVLRHAAVELLAHLLLEHLHGVGEHQREQAADQQEQPHQGQRESGVEGVEHGRPAPQSRASESANL